MHWVEIEGPLGPWPPAGYQRLFDDVPLEPQSVAKAKAAGAARPAATRQASGRLVDLRPARPGPGQAARRRRAADPVVPAPGLSPARRRGAAALLRRSSSTRPSTRACSFAEAMVLGYKAALCSPHFLFLTERIDDSRGDRRSRAGRLRHRLAAVVFPVVVDAGRELLELAAKGELRRPAVLRAQVERLLNDPKAHRFTANFAGQWLDLRNINATSPDPQIYGEFDDFLFWSMPRETERFFEEILRARPQPDRIRRLGLDVPESSGWPSTTGSRASTAASCARSTLPPDSHRGGVLTQASVLKVTADGTRTSPVLRGKWVLDRILGQPPSPPPPDIPVLEPDIRGATTIRQQLDKHRNTPACASCHRHIDPPGFALETFDVIGGWRDFYRATPARPPHSSSWPTIRAARSSAAPTSSWAATTPDGQAFKDIDDYKRLLLADKDQLARNLARKLLIYATGADIQFADREVVEDLVALPRPELRLPLAVHEVVQSRVFLNK